MRAAGLACLAALAAATGADAAGLAFDYPAACNIPNGPTSFAISEKMYICINFNGKVSSLFNVVTDGFAAISVKSCELRRGAHTRGGRSRPAGVARAPPAHTRRARGRGRQYGAAAAACGGRVGRTWWPAGGRNRPVRIGRRSVRSRRRDACPHRRDACPHRRDACPHRRDACPHRRTLSRRLASPPIFPLSPHRAANYALPAGSGYLEEGVGWVPTIAPNVSQVSTFYATFDVSAIGAVSTYPRVYKRLTYTPNAAGGADGDIITIPLYTVIISLTDGVVSDIAWDDGCFFCPENTEECAFSAYSVNGTGAILDPSLRGCRKTSGECYPDSYTTAGTNATSSAATTDVNATLVDGGCDLKVFVTFTGTDRNGMYLRSAGKRFSRYRQFGIATAYQSAINLANEGANVADSAIGAITSMPGKLVPAVGGDDEVGRRMLRAAMAPGGGGEGGSRAEGGEEEEAENVRAPRRAVEFVPVTPRGPALEGAASVAA
jgi:hypothetical protein